MAVTYNNLYLDIRRRLKQAGYPGAGLEARELVCYGSGKSREAFFRDAQLYVAPEIEEKILALVARHLEGEPVAYLIGEWEFYGLPLDVSEAVLIPRTDTEVLAREAIRYLRFLGKCRVLDLCAGSGCVGLAIAANVPEARVLLGEISEGAVRICRQNIRRNSLTGQVSVMTMDALAPPPRALGEFQCIVSNPPYIPGRTWRLWSTPCGTTSPTWPSAAGRTATTSIPPSSAGGRMPWSPAGGCTSRWGSARQTRCCG